MRTRLFGGVLLLYVVMFCIGCASTCEVHQTPLKTKWMPVWYGFPCVQEFHYAHENCPHTSLNAFGGSCMPNLFGPFFRPVGICEECEVELAYWRKNRWLEEGPPESDEPTPDNLNP